MINSITLKGYKSFNEKTVKIAPLTILTGLNGSGKSSVIQAVRMILSGTENRGFLLPGYGDYEELRSRYSVPKKPIEIEVTTDSDVYCLKISKDRSELNKKFQCVFEYISAERLGPQTNLPINNSMSVTIGNRGEYCADYFYKFESCIVGDYLYREESVSKTLIDQLCVWMNDISPKTKFEFSLDQKHDVSNVEIDGYRATNTGFGISYALPIVLSTLVLTSKQCNDFKHSFVDDWYSELHDKHKILMIENPEAHIHPTGQTKLGILAVLAAKSGVQVLVETHSDHFIDGVRIACKESNFSEETIINYFTKDVDSQSDVEKILVLPNGELSNWPKGFFDQINLNLYRLARM